MEMLKICTDGISMKDLFGEIDPDIPDDWYNEGFQKYGYFYPAKGPEQYPEYRKEESLFSKGKILEILHDELKSLENIETDDMEYVSDEYYVFGQIAECKALIDLFEKL